MLRVSEQFYTIQGEGKTMGVPAYFVRLQACNLMCGGVGTEKDGALHNGATWRCDTIEVWTKGVGYKVEELASILNKLDKTVHIVFTGGEPLLQQGSIADLIEALDFTVFIEVETNGTIIPSPRMLDLVDLWNISPKLANSGVTIEKRFNPTALRKLMLGAQDFQIKFVVRTAADVEEALSQYSMVDPAHIFLMPGADNKADLATIGPDVAELAKAYGLNYSHRLHIDLWDKKTGV